MIKVTESALNQVNKELETFSELKDGNSPHIRLHMAVGGGGPQLNLTLVESIDELDITTEVDGINFIYATNQKSYFTDTKLDYVKTIFGGREFKLLRV